jgi:AraC-like DNA-binding protein
VQSIDGITSAHFAAPHPELSRYVTTYYVAEVNSPDGQEVTDLLHPEWGSVRYLCRGSVRGSAQPDPMVAIAPVTLIGHSSRASQIACASMRIASFGLLPLGWQRFVGLPASRFADRSADASETKTRTDFAALFNAVSTAKGLGEIAAIFDTALLHTLSQPTKNNEEDEAMIEALHVALLDPEVSSVAEINGRLDITATQLERLSKRVFGFAPKLLLRRQRFLRTLALLMREPQSKWGEILDPQYYDQAHFNRDFQRFFGMSPKQYLALDKPIVLAGAIARMEALGDPLQGLHAPRGK